MNNSELESTEALIAPEADIAIGLRTTAAIVQVLMRALDNRSTLAVRIHPSNLAHSSMLLEVDCANQMLIFDEIHPSSRTPVLEGSVMNVEGRVDGGRVQFSCVIAEVLKVHGATAYRAHLPAKIISYERRSMYRLTIPSELNLPPAVLNCSRGQLQARLTDISRTGAGTFMAGSVDGQIGSTLPCVIHLPGTRLSAQVQIRSMQTGSGTQRLGLQFSELAAARRYSVDHAIAALERSLLRHHITSRWT